MEIRRMWENGPKRETSSVKESSTYSALDTGIYGGMYICDKCEQRVVGLYRVTDWQNRGYTQAIGWICGGCRQSNTPKGKQPPALQKHREAKQRSLYAK